MISNQLESFNDAVEFRKRFSKSILLITIDLLPFLLSIMFTFILLYNNNNNNNNNSFVYFSDKNR